MVSWQSKGTPAAGRKQGAGPAAAGSRGYWFWGLLAGLIMVLPSGGFAATLPELAEEAYQNNQELQSLKENARALRAEAPSAGSLQDPVVGVGLVNVPIDTFDLDQEPTTQKQLFVAQRFPWFGTLDLRQQVSVLKAQEAEYQVVARKLEIGKNLASAWYELGFVAKSRAVNKDLQAIVTQLLRVAETRYGTGEGLQQDVLTGQVNLSTLLDEEVTLTSREQVVRARIASLLNRDLAFLEAAPLLTAPPESIPAQHLLTRVAIEANPLVQARRAAVDRARLEVQLARKAYLPDFDLRLTYGQREDRPDMVAATLGMTVPLWHATNQDSKLAAAERRLVAAERSLAGLQETLPHSIDQVLTAIDGAKRNHQLFSTALTVQAAQLADASLAAYSVGKVEFNTMLSARIGLLRIGLQADNYTYQIYSKLAELEELAGTELTALEKLR